jgi:hypothetical protein
VLKRSSSVGSVGSSSYIFFASYASLTRCDMSSQGSAL